MPGLPIFEVVVANITTITTTLATPMSSPTALALHTAYDTLNPLAPRSNGQFRNEAGLAVLFIVAEHIVKAAWHKVTDVVDKHAEKKEEEAYLESVRVSDLKAQNPNPPPTAEQISEVNGNLGGGRIPAAEIGGTGAWVGPLHPGEGKAMKRDVGGHENVTEVSENAAQLEDGNKDAEAQPVGEGETAVGKDDEAQLGQEVASEGAATPSAQADYKDLNLWDRIQWHIHNEGLNSAQAFDVVENEWKQGNNKMEEALHEPLHGPLNSPGHSIDNRREGNDLVQNAKDTNSRNYEREQALESPFSEMDRVAKRLLDDAVLVTHALHQARVAKLEEARGKFEDEHKKRFWGDYSYRGDGVERRALFQRERQW